MSPKRVPRSGVAESAETPEKRAPDAVSASDAACSDSDSDVPKAEPPARRAIRARCRKSRGIRVAPCRLVRFLNGRDARHGHALCRTCGLRSRSLRKQPAFTAVAVATLALGHRRQRGDVRRRQRGRPAAAAVRGRRSARARDGRLHRPRQPGHRPVAAGALRLPRSRRSLRRRSPASIRSTPTSPKSTSPSASRSCSSSPSYFSLLGAQPQLGRLFGAEDNAPGHRRGRRHQRCAVEAAVRRHGRTRSAASCSIDNDWYEVVGVMPPGFRHPGPRAAHRRRHVGAGRLSRGAVPAAREITRGVSR